MIRHIIDDNQFVVPFLNDPGDIFLNLVFMILREYLFPAFCAKNDMDI